MDPLAEDLYYEQSHDDSMEFYADNSKPPKECTAENLIDVVMSKQLLWKKDDPSYHNLQKSYEAWSVVAVELGLSSSEFQYVKDEWTKLCNRYEEEQKKYRTPAPNTTYLEWPYFQQMSFLGDQTSTASDQKGKSTSSEVKIKKLRGPRGKYKKRGSGKAVNPQVPRPNNPTSLQPQTTSIEDHVPKFGHESPAAVPSGSPEGQYYQSPLHVSDARTTSKELRVDSRTVSTESCADSRTTSNEFGAEQYYQTLPRQRPAKRDREEESQSDMDPIRLFCMMLVGDMKLLKRKRQTIFKHRTIALMDELLEAEENEARCTHTSSETLLS